VEPLSACRDGVPGFLWGRVGGLGHVVGPVASVGVLSDELDGDGTLDVVGHVEQLASNNPDVVLLEAGLGLGNRGWGRRPLNRDWLLSLRGRRGLYSVTLWRSLLLLGRRKLLVLWLLLLLVLHRRLLLLLLWCVPDPAKVVHDTSLLGLVAPGDCAGRVGAGGLLAGALLSPLEGCVVSAAEVSHVCF